MKHSLLLFICLSISINFYGQGSAIDLDGTDDYVESGSNIGITGNASRTVEAWIKTTNASGQRVIVDFGTNSSAQRFSFVVNAGVLRIEIQGTGTATTTSVADGEWHHVAVVYDNSITNDYALYIDGTLEKSANLTTANTSASNLFIGKRASGSSYFDGQIDEVRVWNVARSASEILENMHKELTPGSEANLVVYYQMEHTDGEITVTDSKSSNNGTWSGSGGSNTTSNFETSYAALGNATAKNQTNVRGLWQATGTNTSSESDGFTTSVGVALTETNLAVFGHDNAGTGTSTSDLSSSAATERISQIWYVDEVGTVSGATLTFDLGTITGGAATPVAFGNYRLLYRAGTSGDFSDDATATSIANTDQVVFTSVDLQDGYYTIGSTTSILPVELVSFHGEIISKEIQLHWQTASEINNRGFDIEKSIDGKNWEVLDFVEGNGTTTALSNYYYTDEQPSLGLNYYRLKQIDFDEKYTYSDIISVDFATGISPQIQLYPNPVQNELNIVNGQGIVTIYNSLGQMVKQFHSIDNILTINIENWTKGQCYLQVTTSDGTIITKPFVKE